MSVILTMICHASTQAVRDAAFPSDEPLDGPGQASAAALAASIRRVDQARTSPALRARQTAGALLLDATSDPLLRDVDYGRWAGRSLANVAATDPAGVAAWLHDPAAAPHGGEPVAALLQRMAEWLDGLAAAEGRVVAVTHAANVRAAVIRVLDAAPASFWRIDAPPLCRLRLRGDGGRWTLLSLGERDGGRGA